MSMEADMLPWDHDRNLAVASAAVLPTALPTPATVSTGNWAGTGYSLTDIEHGMPRYVADPIVVARLAEVQAQLKQLRQDEADLQNLLRQWLQERKGTVVVGGGWEAVVDSGAKEYVYNYEKLSELQAYLPPDEYDKVVVYTPPPTEGTYTVRKAELNKLIKRGGPVAEIAAAGFTEAPGGPGKLVVRRRK